MLKYFILSVCVCVCDVDFITLFFFYKKKNGLILF